jgi:hypothetical protein
VNNSIARDDRPGHAVKPASGPAAAFTWGLSQFERKIGVNFFDIIGKLVSNRVQDKACKIIICKKAGGGQFIVSVTRWSVSHRDFLNYFFQYSQAARLHPFSQPSQNAYLSPRYNQIMALQNHMMFVQGQYRRQ